MPHTSRSGKSSKSCNEDRISALPDDVLHHVLGFLPADEAVHTSLLAKRWRYLWKSMRRIRINDLGRCKENSHILLTKFMNCLLLLGGHSSTLDEGFSICYLDGPPLVFRYLRRLQVSDLRLKSNFLKFSSCSTPEYLKIKDCNLETSSILSQSLKHLSIKDCYFKNDGRIRISVPNLVSLQLKSCGGRAPLLESMLSLETAVVRPQICLKDCCFEGVAEGCCGTCADCCGNDDHNGGCVLLGGLSRAKNLELIADPEMFIFRRDLRWCPTFSKLKTLLLSEWCVQPDLHALVCMLEHSLVLENLTLQLCKQEKPACAVEVEENAGLMEKPAAISGYLKTIKVKCEEVDDRVCRVLKFLSTFGIEITI